jgi:hypothetical protein
MKRYILTCSEPSNDSHDAIMNWETDAERTYYEYNEEVEIEDWVDIHTFIKENFGDITVSGYKLIH